MLCMKIMVLPYFVIIYLCRINLYAIFNLYEFDTILFSVFRTRSSYPRFLSTVLRLIFTLDISVVNYSPVPKQASWFPLIAIPIY